MASIRIKKLPLVVLSVLLAVCCAAASADSVRLSVQGFEEKAFASDHKADRPVLASFREAYPDVRLSVTGKVSYRTTKKLLQALEKKEYKADVFTVDSSEVDVRAILSSGYCLDLTDNPAIASLIARMHPSIAETAQVDGCVYGVPVGLSTTSQLYYLEKGWQAAGLTAADVPSSYTGLLDFLEVWILRQQTDPVDVCVSSDFDRESLRPTVYTTWLLETLLRGYGRQCAAAGRPATFDDPTLLALMERTKAVGARLYELHEWERPNEYGALFTVLVDQPQLMPRLVPDRMTEEEPLVISATVTIACVNANRPYSAEAAQNFLAHYMTWMHDHTTEAYGILENYHDEDYAYTDDDYLAESTKALLFADTAGPIHSRNPHAVVAIGQIIERYQNILEGNVEKLDAYGRKAIPKTEEARQKWAADLAYLQSPAFYAQRYREALDFTEEELTRYQAMTPHLVFLREHGFETTSRETASLLMRYAEDRLSLEQLMALLREQP